MTKFKAGDDDWWEATVLEPFEEWAKHQKAVPDSQTLSYTDFNGDTKPLDRFHLHELVDRIHCVQKMLDHLLQSHPAGHLVAEELEATQEKLGDAYQKAGEISFEMFEKDKE